MLAVARFALLACVATACNAARRPVPPRPVPEPLLSRSGLYADFASRAIAPGWELYTPAYALWADRLHKRRWIQIPAGAAIDKSDRDHWEFPVGTRVFKEFATAEGRPLETRLIEKIGPRQLIYGAYLWRADGSDADWTQAGARDVLGTDHDVPSAADCGPCHDGEPGHILGYSSVQLAPPPPWPAPVRDALGYLHANCGSCHYPVAGMPPAIRLNLRLSVADLALADPRATSIAASIDDVPTTNLFPKSEWRRLAPGDPARTLLLYRMAERGNKAAMPPLASKHPDTDGLAAVTALVHAWNRRP